MASIVQILSDWKISIYSNFPKTLSKVTILPQIKNAENLNS